MHRLPNRMAIWRLRFAALLLWVNYLAFIGMVIAFFRAFWDRDEEEKACWGHRGGARLRGGGCGFCMCVCFRVCLCAHVACLCLCRRWRRRVVVSVCQRVHACLHSVVSVFAFALASVLAFALAFFVRARVCVRGRACGCLCSFVFAYVCVCVTVCACTRV